MNAGRPAARVLSKHFCILFISILLKSLLFFCRKERKGRKAIFYSIFAIYAFFAA